MESLSVAIFIVTYSVGDVWCCHLLNGYFNLDFTQHISQTVKSDGDKANHNEKCFFVLGCEFLPTLLHSLRMLSSKVI